MKIGDVIRAFRIRRGLKLEAMALEMGVAISTLSRIEKDLRSPSLEMLALIAQHLNVPVSVIFRAAEGHWVDLPEEPAGQIVQTNDYSSESVQLRQIMQHTSPRNRRLVLEFAKLLERELGI